MTFFKTNAPQEVSKVSKASKASTPNTVIIFRPLQITHGQGAKKGLQNPVRRAMSLKRRSTLLPFSANSAANGVVLQCVLPPKTPQRIGGPLCGPAMRCVYGL